MYQVLRNESGNYTVGQVVSGPCKLFELQYSVRGNATDVIEAAAGEELVLLEKGDAEWPSVWARRSCT